MKIVAEMGGSHGHDFKRALDIIKIAKDCGADYVKFQTMTPETLAVDVPITVGEWKGLSYRKLYEETALPLEWHAELFAYARGVGITPFSTPFSEACVDFLEHLNCPMYKIASAEITHLDLISYAAQTGKPMIISTGMANQAEIDCAVEACLGNLPTLLACVSRYPAVPDDYAFAGLLNYPGPKGVSDHTLTCDVARVAASLSFDMIERHLTTTMYLPDDRFATSAAGFKEFVQGIKNVEKMLTSYQTPDTELLEYRRSLWVTREMEPGEVFTPVNVQALRPYRKDGIELSSLVVLLSEARRAKHHIRSNTCLTWDDIL